MKKYNLFALTITLLISALLSLNTFAQTKFAYVFKDDFSANKHKWPTGTNEKYNLQIFKEKAVLVYSQKKGFFVTKESHINAGRNFQINGLVIFGVNFPIAIIEKIDQSAILKPNICVVANRRQRSKTPSFFLYLGRVVHLAKCRFTNN